MVYFKENYTFPRFQRGSNIFQGGGSNFFQGGGSNRLFPKETHITCDFIGGQDPLSPPLDPRIVLLALLYVRFSFVFVAFPYGVLGQGWYLIVRVPNLCYLPYFN